MHKISKPMLLRNISKEKANNRKKKIFSAVIIFTLLLSILSAIVFASLYKEKQEKNEKLDLPTQNHRKVFDIMNPPSLDGVDIEQFKNYTRMMAEETANYNQITSSGNDDGDYQTTAAVGTQKILVLLIEFPNTTHNAIHTTQYYDNLLFNQSASSNSMYNYYKEVSYNQLTVVGNITTVWLNASHNMSYYGKYEFHNPPVSGYGNALTLVEEAVDLANATINFANFDTDNDGIVDHLLVVHAGEADESNGNGGPDEDDAIWSHAWAISPKLVDGVYVSAYTMLAEGSPLGTFAHEFGHDLGLPDLYDIDYSSQGIGKWSLMASGSWNNGGNTPAHLDAWSKYFLGWTTPTLLKRNATDVNVNRAEDNQDVYMIQINNNSKEFFLIENRQKVKYDSYLPGGGILIWHIDNKTIEDGMSSNTVNSNDSRRGVDLEGADESTNGDSPNRATNPWYHGNTYMNSSGFTPNTVPNSKAYEQNSKYVIVRNFSASANTMTFNATIYSLYQKITTLTGVVKDVNGEIYYNSPNNSVRIETSEGTWTTQTNSTGQYSKQISYRDGEYNSHDAEVYFDDGNNITGYAYTDSAVNNGTTEKDVITDQPIPEFSIIAIVLIATISLFAIFRRRK